MMSVAKVRLNISNEIRYYVADDCVVFEGDHVSCCGKIVKVAREMVTKAAAAGKKKVVIFGDCDDYHEEHEIKLAEAMTAVGIEYVWFPHDVSNHETDAISGFFEMRIRCFQEAAQYATLRKMMGQVGHRILGIRDKIANEARLLVEYPLVASLVSIESDQHNDLCGRPSNWEIIFGGHRPHTLVSKVRAVALFNEETQSGILVTESAEIKFTVPPAYRHQGVDVPGFASDILQGRRKGRERGYTTEHGGSVRVDIGDGNTPVKLYCHPGVWMVKPHPELDTGDLNVRYVPMWERTAEIRS